MFQALELRSQAMLMDGISVYDDRGDHVIQRTPTEPDFWEGNRVILRDADAVADTAIGWHRAAFPQAAHLCFAFDLPNMPMDRVDPGFAAAGCKVEMGDTLVMADDLPVLAVPDGLTVRRLESNADWSLSHALSMVWAADDGYDLRLHNGFLYRCNVRRRAQIAQGRGAWFGVFDADALVAQMGIFAGQGLARYQEVQTARRYRGRGIASGLLVHAGRWARAQSPGVPLVIVADTDAPAGRVYRRVGFDPAETLICAINRGY